MDRIFGIGACLALAPAVLAAQEPIRRQVDSLHAAMVAAFTANPGSTTKYYTDDAAVVGGGLRVVGRTAIDAYWAGIDAGSTWKLETLDVGGTSEVPWVHGRSTLGSATSGRTSITEYIGLLQHGTDGQLRFRVDAYTETSGAASATDEAVIRGLDSLWARVYQTHDTAAALQLYAEPLVFIGANGRQKTRAEELALYHERHAARYSPHLHGDLLTRRTARLADRRFADGERSVVSWGVVGDPAGRPPLAPTRKHHENKTEEPRRRRRNPWFFRLFR